jgi:hypothetical protein
MKFTRFAPFSTLFLLSLSALGLAPAVQGADVSIYTVKKGFQYAQTNSGPPVAGTTNSFVFEADVNTILGNVVSSATVLPPGGTNQALVEQPSQNQFQLRHKYNSLTTLNTHYPDGPPSYVLGVDTIHDGSKMLSLLLTGAAYPTSAPQLTDFPTLQMVNVNGYFQAAWNSFAGGTSNDFVEFRIETI